MQQEIFLYCIHVTSVTTNDNIKVKTDFTLISHKWTFAKLIVSGQTKIFNAEKMAGFLLFGKLMKEFVDQKKRKNYIVMKHFFKNR